MKHKHADLLHYAAENADAMFIAPTIDNPAPISHVTSYPLLDWRIHRPKPKTVTKWLWATANGEITDYLMDEKELTLTNKYGDRMSYQVKLEWSATEFEVDE